jgi:hypothetical protein
VSTALSSVPHDVVRHELHAADAMPSLGQLVSVYPPPPPSVAAASPPAPGDEDPLDPQATMTRAPTKLVAMHVARNKDRFGR